MLLSGLLSKISDSCSRTRTQSFLILRTSEPGSEGPLYHLEQNFRYAKLKYEVAGHSQNWSGRLHQYTGLVFLPGADSEISGKAAKRIEEFVRRGGGVFAILPGISPHSQSLFRITDQVSSVHREDESSPCKIKFSEDFFPGFSAREIDHGDYQPVTGVMEEHSNEVEVLASLTDGFPVVWQRRLGEGSLVVWNIDYVWSFQWRGPILQALLRAPAVSVQCIANAASIQVDDFPAGFADIQSSLLEEEFGVSFVPFLDQIWLPDMLKLGQELNVPLTCAIPFSYNEQLEPPFEFAEWTLIKNDDENIPVPVIFAKRLLDAGHELAMHGYNHVQIDLEHWPSSEMMQSSFTAAKARWELDELGPLPRCYIPPMNLYDESGIQAMSQALPAVRVICGTEGEDPAHGGRREFGPEPWAPHLFCLPRWTYGYFESGEDPLSLISEVSMLGVWTHFIHADDIIDTETQPGQTWKARNEKRMFWRDSPRGSLLESLRQWIRSIQQVYPWLRFYTASKAGEIVKQHLDNKVSVTFVKNNQIEIEAEHPADFIIRLPRKADVQNPALENLEILCRYRLGDFDMFVLRMKRQKGILGWKID